MTRKDLQLNNKQYSILLPPPTAAMPLCSRAAVLVGSFAGLLADIKTLGDTTLSKEQRLASCLEKLGDALKGVDPIATNGLMMDAAYAGKLTCDGQSISVPIDFDRHFDNHRGEVYQVLVWCLWECVADFFPQLGTFTQQMKSAAATAFQSPKDGQ
jgi:hypothetical protein